MNFAIEKEDLLTGLARAQSIVERRTAMPILANVLLEAKKGELIITATDLEVGIRGSHPAMVEKEGGITLPAKNLFEIVKELPRGKITFQKKENFWVQIASGKAVFNIVGLSPEDYPSLPNHKDKKFYDMNPQILKEMIEKTIFSVSNDETRYHLNGIFFEKSEKDGNRMRMVATDGHRLSLIDKTFDFSNELTFTRGVIIPKKGMVEIRKLLEEEEGSYQIGFDTNNVIIRKESVVLFIRLIDGEYPDYQQVIPAGNKKKIVVNRDKFLSSLRRISLLANERSKAIRLSVKPNVLEISTNNPEVGEAKEEIDISYMGQTMETAFNARYFMDILSAMQSEAVILELDDKLSPGVVRPTEDSECFFVVMPMRI